MARLNGLWQCNIISFASRLKLYKSLVTSCLLYGCETWALLADSERKRIQAFETKCGSKGTSSGNCQGTETCMIRACHTPRQPLQNLPSGHLGGRAMPWSADEMLNGQHQRVDIFAHVRTVHKGLLQKKRRRGSLLNRPSYPPDDPIGQWAEVNCDGEGGGIRKDVMKMNAPCFV